MRTSVQPVAITEQEVMQNPNEILKGHRLHPRRFEDSAYVYPVLSRRSGGISIGINLNPSKLCNMDCVYCQVDRNIPARRSDVDLGLLREELFALAQDTLTGALFHHPRFKDTPERLRRLNDFALSGDGEPTTFKPFNEAIEVVVDVKQSLHLDDVKIVLITDSGCLHHGHVKQGLQLMDAHQGVIWAKLDAGSEAYYRTINRTKIPFDRVLKNIIATAQERPIILQTLFMRLNDQGPDAAEVAAYIERVQTIETEGSLEEVHLYTVARPPSETWVTPLSNDQLDSIATRVTGAIQTPVKVFYGA
jgi:wyosine [tRNA(Phe)-imidazoG37] synthetase (radical SAM superfamily)